MKLKILILACFVQLICSCTSSSSFIPYSDYYAFKESKADKWGLIDANGKILIKDEFEQMPTGCCNGIFFVPSEKGASMYSTNKPTIPIGDEYKAITPFYSDVTPSVRENEVIKVIDKQGQVKFELPPHYTSASAFYNGYSIIFNKKTKRYEVVTSKGEFIKSDSYTILRPLPKDFFVGEDIKSNNIVLLDKKLNKIEKLCKSEDFKYVTPDVKYFVFIDDEGKMGLKNINGEIKIRPKYDHLIYVNETCILVGDSDGKYGVINIGGEIVIRPKYSDIGFVKKSHLAVLDGAKEKFGVINMNGETELPFDYSVVGAFPNSDNFIVQDYGDDYAYIVNKNWERIDRKEYEMFDILGDLFYGDWYQSLACLYKLSEVESDYLDVSEIVKSMLENSEEPLAEFSQYYGRHPGDVARALNLDLTADDISDYIDMEWLPSENPSLKNYEYANIVSYRLGFDKIVEQYQEYYRTRYRFSSTGTCKALEVKARLNSKVNQKEKQILEGIDSAFKENGYIKDTNYKTAVYNNKYTIFYGCDDGELYFIYMMRNNTQV